MNTKKENGTNALKAVLIVIGAVVAVSGVVMVLYSLFKKYFKITFECGCEDGCDCFSEDEDNYEPFCFCENEDGASDESNAEEDAE